MSEPPLPPPAHLQIRASADTATMCSQADIWRPKSIALTPAGISKVYCGLLNKLTKINFWVIARRMAELAIAIERSDDTELLPLFVRSIFTRGIAEENLQGLYATLCRRIIEELEDERNRWRNVDLCHVRDPIHLFETALRLLVSAEFDRVDTQTPQELPRLMAFVAELLVHGVVSVSDVEGPLASLFERAEQSDTNAAIALCHFFSDITPAFHAFHILDSLHASARIERVIREDALSPGVKYPMMRLLEQVAHPQPPDALSPIEQQIDMSGLYLDDDGEDDEGSEESDIDNDESIEASCQIWSDDFIAQGSIDHLADVLHSLRPHHRLYLLGTLISSAIYSNDNAIATLVGTLDASPRIQQLCRCEGSNMFLDSLTSELRLLPDTSLDVPNACQLWAHMLRSTGVEQGVIEELLSQALSDQAIKSTLMHELKSIGERERTAPSAARYGGDVRENRFERCSRDKCCKGPGCSCVSSEAKAVED